MCMTVFVFVRAGCRHGSQGNKPTTQSIGREEATCVSALLRESTRAKAIPQRHHRQRKKGKTLALV